VADLLPGAAHPHPGPGAADVVITISRGDACPLLPGKHYEDWELDDPVGKTLDQIRPIRDEIKVRVANSSRNSPDGGFY
jgi:hypothetical protein